MRPNDIGSFAAGLVALGLSQPDIAVAFLWFKNNESEGSEATAAELAQLMDSFALSSGANRWRLDTQLRQHGDTVRGSRADTFRIRLSSKTALDAKYLPLLKGRPVKVDHVYLPSALTAGTRPYLVKFSWEINGCYEHGFYDGAAVLARRLVETLLIDAFEQAGQSAVIKTGVDYKQLSDIIALAKSGQYIKLGRGTGKALDRIKLVGDTAAHDRTYVTSQRDMDDLALEFRRVVSELMNLAGIHPS